MSIIPQSLDAHVFIVFEISMSLAFCRGTGNFGKKNEKMPRDIIINLYQS